MPAAANLAPTSSAPVKSSARTRIRLSAISCPGKPDESDCSAMANSSLPRFVDKAQMRVDQAKHFMRDILNVSGGAPSVVGIGGFSRGKTENGVRVIAHGEAPDQLRSSRVKGRSYHNDRVFTLAAQLVGDEPVFTHGVRGGRFQAPDCFLGDTQPLQYPLIVILFRGVVDAELNKGFIAFIGFVAQKPHFRSPPLMVKVGSFHGSVRHLAAENHNRSRVLEGVRGNQPTSHMAKRPKAGTGHDGEYDQKNQ